MPQFQTSSTIAESELCHATKECDIYFHKALKAVESKWKGLFMHTEQLQQIFDKIIEVLKAKQVSKAILDIRKMKVISGADQLWIINNWCPRAIDAGFKRQALVITTDSFSEVAFKNIVRHYNHDKIRTAYFTGIKEAYNWASATGDQNVK